MRNTKAATLLDALRLAAAQAVLVGHAIILIAGGYSAPGHDLRIPYLQNIGVQVFFVLSGFLIASALTRKASFTDYLIDRFARIYSGLVPALLFMLALSLVFPNPNLTPVSFVGNLLLLNHVVVRSVTGPLWSLMVEWHIYLFVGALYFVRGTPVLLLVALAFGIVPMLFLAGDAGKGVGAGVFGLWLYGFAGYFALPYLKRLPSSALMALCIGSLTAYCAAMFTIPQGSEFRPVDYPMLALAFLSAVALTTGRPMAENRFIRFGADYSFTLYLIHYPILQAMAGAFTGWTGLLASVALANVVAIALAYPTEMQHRRLAAALRAALPRVKVWARSVLAADG